MSLGAQPCFLQVSQRSSGAPSHLPVRARRSYTPLLPAVATGTIEERSIVEPVRRIIAGKGNYFEASVEKILPDEQVGLRPHWQLPPGRQAGLWRKLASTNTCTAPQPMPTCRGSHVICRLWWRASHVMWASQRPASR